MYKYLLVLSLTYLLRNGACTDTNYRLNTPIVPSGYQIWISPYFDTGDANAFTFDGRVTIRFTTTANTNQIKLHSEELIYNSTDIVVEVVNTGATIELTSTNALEFDTNYTFAYINLATELQPEFEYSLQITYKGPVRNDLQGFYRNYYLESGVRKWLGATQMEPTHARKVFPSFDEPELKATFTVTIDRPANYKPSLSNTEIDRTEVLANGNIRETFFPTPRMSTYLVAFLVSEFEAAAFSHNGTEEFGIFTRPEAKNQSDFAFDFGKKIVDALGDYLGINYYTTNSHLRLDHVALPDFRAGAMENWGLIKYREALLLYVPEQSTPYFKYRVAQIMAHETTHMWFGNLVTCHWWSNTWLNEGFANYFQDFMTSLVEPELGSANMLVTSSVYAAYDADNTPSSAPITNNDVNSPAEISAHFGTISYQKAGSVIRMIHHLLQDDAFKFGLNFYLRNNSLSSGYPEKLYQGLSEGVSAFNALSSYPGANIGDVMSSWISQPGHPVLQVNINYEADTVTLTQKRYYINGSLSSNETYKIPITYTTQQSPDFGNTKPVFIMENRTHEFQIANISQQHGWIIFNVQETGFYRVNYDDHAWQIIISALRGSERSRIHPLNRAKIVNDLFAFVYADEISFSTLYDALEFLSGETDYSVWYAAVRGFGRLRRFYLGDNEAQATVEEFILRFLNYGVSTFGLEEKVTDSFEDLRNRMQILDFACTLGHSECVEQSISLFRALRFNGTEVAPSLRPVVYCNGLRHGNEEDYEFLWNRMMTTNVANEVWIIGETLGCTTSEPMLRRYLVSMTVENSPVRTQDLTVPLTSVLGAYANLNLVVNELRSNYTLWSTIYPSMETIVSTVATALHTEADCNEFETWLNTCTECTEATKAAARSSLAQARASTSWARSHRAAILNSLRSASNIAVPSTIVMIFALTIQLFKEY